MKSIERHVQIKSFKTLNYISKNRKVNMNNELQKHCKHYARETGVRAEVHAEDYIFRFLLENKVFKTKRDAVRYYFYDGQKSAKKLAKLLFSKLGLEKNNASILEFASGYGCITRHLVRYFSSDRLVCSDIHPEANEFLSQTFGVKILQSTENPSNYPTDYNFDTVFALSFFSHMPPGHGVNGLSSYFY